MFQQFVILVSMVFLSSCFSNKESSFILRDHSAKVLIMLAPECPLCKNYTKDIKEMQAKYSQEIIFYGIVPGSYYSAQEVDSFLNSYNLPLNIIFDADLSLCKALNATVTPEVFFIDEYNTIRYRGMFDNWLGELGRRRLVVTQYYLRDALDAYLEGTDINIKKTKAVGCFIE